MSVSRRRRGVGQGVVLVAYYAGAYGPTLRIDIHSPERLAELLGHFRQLSSGGDERFELGALSETVVDPPLEGVTLAASRQRASSGAQDKVKRVTSPGGKLSLVWTQTEWEWGITAELTEALREAAANGLSGHQYLTDESKDGVLVELAVGE